MKERSQTRDRVAKFRQLKKEKQSTPTNIDSPPKFFKSRSALGKAVARAKRALPNSPRHKDVVVKKLFSDECNVNLDACFQLSENSMRGNPLSPETVNSILEFYERDDISRQAPGRKDVVTVRENGKKFKKQARHLVYSLKEVFELYKIENPSETVGKSKFAEMRPKHVLLSNKLPHNVCMCFYHENFINAINSLHLYNKEVPIYSFSFPEGLMCKPVTQKCWLNECVTCNNAQGFKKAYPLPDTDEAGVKWKYWKKDEHNQLVKVERVESYTDLYSYVADLVPQFLAHCYVKREQAHSYKSMHQLILSDDYPRDQCMIQIDFSENYTCISQDEIQSAHWQQQQQISLFTAAMYHSGAVHPIVFVSDFLNHSKEAVVGYITYLLDQVPSHTKEIQIWSDGPSSQFKNRFVAASINVLETKYAIKITWNYFATSHGKGPVDGIGGTSKRQAFDQVKKRKCQINSASDYVSAVKMAGTNILTLEVTEDEIKRRNSELDIEQVWEHAPIMTGIKKYHCIQVEDGEPKGYLLSADRKKILQLSSSSSMIDIVCDDWYEVEYDGLLYPGKVTTILNNEFEITTMIQVGRNWKWPEPEDKIFYPKSKLIRKLKPPIPVNSRGFYKFVTD